MPRQSRIGRRFIRSARLQVLLFLLAHLVTANLLPLQPQLLLCFAISCWWGKFKRLHSCSSDVNFTLVLTSKPLPRALHKFSAWIAPARLFATLNLQANPLLSVFRYSRFNNAANHLHLCTRRLLSEGRVGQHWNPSMPIQGGRLVKIQNVESAADQMLLLPAACLLVNHCKGLIESCHGEGGRARCSCSGLPSPPSPTCPGASQTGSCTPGRCSSGRPGRIRR